MRAQPKPARRGRPSTGADTVAYTVRLPRDLAEWLDSRGGRIYLRELIDRERGETDKVRS